MYDPKTGRLQLLKYDANRNGTTDRFTHMDGARVLRVEIDNDEDGRFERTEHYGVDQKLQRVELDARGAGRMSRVEHYEREALARAEEDTNADGRMDKWETYDGARLLSVAFDSTHRGHADRRLVYLPDGTVRLELDPEGDGVFEPAR